MRRGVRNEAATGAAYPGSIRVDNWFMERSAATAGRIHRGRRVQRLGQLLVAGFLVAFYVPRLGLFVTLRCLLLGALGLALLWPGFRFIDRLRHRTDGPEWPLGTSAWRFAPGGQQGTGRLRLGRRGLEWSPGRRSKLPALSVPISEIRVARLSPARVRASILVVDCGQLGLQRFRLQVPRHVVQRCLAPLGINVEDSTTGPRQESE